MSYYTKTERKWVECGTDNFLLHGENVSFFMKSFVKRNEDKGIKRKKLFLDRKKAIIRNELYVKIIRTTSKQDTTKG